jgi:hypothetical protein
VSAIANIIATLSNYLTWGLRSEEDGTEPPSSTMHAVANPSAEPETDREISNAADAAAYMHNLP